MSAPGHARPRPRRWWTPTKEAARYASPEPIGGPYLGLPFLALVALAGLAGVLVVWRFAAGLGATTALNDGYPWGLWIAFDVVTGTALACGGYAVAILCYVLNRGKYHPLVRPAILTSAFGYSIAALSVMLDVGRPWLIWKVPLYFWHWNRHSVLLEVALCIMGYAMVSWIEISPAFFERMMHSHRPLIHSIGERGLSFVQGILLWVVGLGVLLPTMHQSSLGSLLLLAGPRLDPLWNTPILPLLFLVSCVGMGFGATVLESVLSSWLLKHEAKRPMLSSLGRAMVPVVGVYLVLRIGDLVRRGQVAALFAFDAASVLTLVELALFVLGAAMLVSERQRSDLGNLLRAAMVLLIAGALYRFDVFLVAFRPGSHWHYFPSVTEILITVGLVAAEIAGYVLLIRFFPILSAGHHPAPAR